MKKYAVLCGNSQFPDEADKNKLPDLACPEQDVDGLGNVLASERGEFNVLSLKNKPSYEVLRELQRKVKQTEAEDLLLFYYSGHGKPNKAGILHLTSFDTVIAELETTAIPISRVYDILGTGKCKKIVIILDCCYSGAAGQGFKGTVDDQLQQLNNSRGTYLVTASTELQVAHESAVEGYSLFTKHLIAGLETGDADKDGDGWVSMNELYDYVHNKVITENPAQQPTKHVKEERGGFFITKSGRDSRKERAEKIRLLLLELEKHDESVAEIKTEALSVAKQSLSQLSATQLQQDELISQLLIQELSLVSFVRAWDKLASSSRPAAFKPKTKFTKKLIAFIINHPKILLIALIGLSGYWIAKEITTVIAEPTKTANTQKTDAPVTATISESKPRHSFEPEMMPIKAGCFQMGSPVFEAVRETNEKQHDACVNDFQIGKYEVTKTQWHAVMGGDLTFPETENNMPVTSVSWNDVQLFIEKLNQQTSQNYRLPTEVEWEYAARAGTSTPFYTGQCINAKQANYNDTRDYNNCGKKGNYNQDTTLVGSYPPNAWGLYDMAGNAAEWTCTVYDETYGTESECANSNGNDDVLDKGRVVRGGKWGDAPWELRSAHRFEYAPESRSNGIGFRLVRL